MQDFVFRILNIDLNSGSSKLELITAEEMRAYLGGPNLGAHMLYPFLTQDLDPLSPEAPLLFLTGPLTGTTGPAVGRYVVCAKSPATHLWGESNVGGHFGPELRWAGYDGLLITGAADEPVYLFIREGEVEIRSASHLWGNCDTYETQERIKDEFDDRLIRVACIGLAGENTLPIAGILCDHGRAAGRTGMGAVMGSKCLKAVAVRGNGPIPVAREEEFKRLRSQANIALRDDNFSRAAREVGSAGIMDYMHYLGEMPTRYFTMATYLGVLNVSGTIVAETILSRVSACHGCVIACGRVVKISDGINRKGPEYETTVGFGPNLGIDDISAITMLGEVCDRYGMDTISSSNILGLAYLLYDEGLLTQADTDGIPLLWGDPESAEQMLHKMARREGIGELLAQGSKAVAEHFHVPEMAVQVNNLEVPYHDPRGSSGSALVYATSPRGACHNQSDYFLVDTYGQTFEEVGIDFYSRHAGVEKVENIARHQDWRTMWNSLVLCYFANVSPETVLDLVNHVTGFEYSLEELLELGERSWNLKRIINHRLGLTRANDRLPDQLLKPFTDGGSEGYVPPFDEMLAAYYKIRGWDPKTGKPIPERLQKLGLQEYIRDIWSE
ncbi:MAG: aldehyde ferredoxin oxidoreductase family protein [Anaerolineaceae bacterium]|nr:MAG: aldehyde ferredoxin oxidoreductase family protein [Anaerolineaceae bacterium]